LLFIRAKFNLNTYLHIDIIYHIINNVNTRKETALSSHS
jgi:hypothetical protein